MVKDNQIIGHILQVNSKDNAFYICHGGTIKCRVTGKRQRKLVLEIPCRYYSKFAKDCYHINPIQKRFENMYLIIDSSDINSVFSIQLQNE